MALTRAIPLMALLVGASALLIPALNVIVASAQTLMTPDALQGRVQSAISFVALCISPLGAAAAGFLLARAAPYPRGSGRQPAPGPARPRRPSRDHRPAAGFIRGPGARRRVGWAALRSRPR